MVAAGAVLLGSTLSLFSAESPRGAGDFEECVYVATLPVSVLGTLIRSLDRDSIAFWVAAVVVWAIFAYFEYRLLAGLPRYFAAHLEQRRIALGAMAAVEFFAVVWLVSVWPREPQEEPALFFVRAPLWLLSVSSIILLLIVASRWAGRRATRADDVSAM